MRLWFLGVRGSTPAPGAAFERYGGSTSAIAVGLDGEPPTLLLDAGTGARRLAGVLGGAPFRGTVLLSHLHWDHTHGLPFARALDHPDACVELHLPAPAAGTALDALTIGMQPPNFPITPAQLRGTWSFVATEPGPLRAGGFSVEAHEVPHKGGRTFGYRISDGRATVAYVPDHGPVALGPGPDGFGELHAEAMALADGVDLLVHDAQHTRAEFAERAGYGHSCIDYAVALGTAAGASTVALFHHDPERTDDELDAIVAAFHDRPGPRVVAAAESLVLDL